MMDVVASETNPSAVRSGNNRPDHDNHVDDIVNVNVTDYHEHMETTNGLILESSNNIVHHDPHSPLLLVCSAQGNPSPYDDDHYDCAYLNFFRLQVQQHRRDTNQPSSTLLPEAVVDPSPKTHPASSQHRSSSTNRRTRRKTTQFAQYVQMISPLWMKLTTMEQMQYQNNNRKKNYSNNKKKKNSKSLALTPGSTPTNITTEETSHPEIGCVQTSSTSTGISSSSYKTTTTTTMESLPLLWNEDRQPPPSSPVAVTTSTKSAVPTTITEPRSTMGTKKRSASLFASSSSMMVPSTTIMTLRQRRQRATNEWLVNDTLTTSTTTSPSLTKIPSPASIQVPAKTKFISSMSSNPSLRELMRLRISQPPHHPTFPLEMPTTPDRPPVQQDITNPAME